MCYNMDKPWKHAKKKKPDTTDHVWFHSYVISRICKYIEIKNSSGMGEYISWGAEIFLKLIMMVAQFWE